MTISRRHIAAAALFASSVSVLAHTPALAESADATAVADAVANLTKAMLAADKPKLEALVVDQLSYGRLEAAGAAGLQGLARPLKSSPFKSNNLILRRREAPSRRMATEMVLLPTLRDAVLRTAPQGEVGSFSSNPPPAP